MTLNALLRPVMLAGLVALGMTAGAGAQTTQSDTHHPDPSPESQAQSSSPDGATGQSDQPGQPGMMGPGMMGPGMMGPGMMGQGMMGQDMMGRMPMMAMRGHMMKIMFAIADADGDGSLSFDEVTAIHKRIFDKVDANKDGKVSTEEIQAFLRP
ncbi:EF-hand domain-containing protein [Sinorhizobium terangae]|uniref:EF-hand domain-containing protein n=1 Tax=Sinorhizobium terangae TaxID=110322 RepID=UPI0024B0A44C|nr:EF-hand domain-containing protein [Sinorhizobium terangae]WFU50893.1 EF-hand domain-containing protein [Sinorhizobium terangae]